MTSLSTRVHTFARPSVKEALVKFFTEILGAEQITMPGSAMVAFKFADSSSYSVEFTEEALDDVQARKGAWLEIKTSDPDVMRTKISEAGFRQVEYPTGRFYFQAPGGQVWGILPLPKE